MNFHKPLKEKQESIGNPGYRKLGIFENHLDFTVAHTTHK